MIMMNQSIHSLAEKGFFHAKEILPKGTVGDLIDAVEAILNENTGKDIMQDLSGHPIKVKYPLSKDPIFMKALANPSLIDLVDMLFPNGDAVLTWEDILVKQPRSDTEVHVHQDLALQKTNGDVFSIGLSLHDDSHNPVFYLPGSHLSGALTRTEVQILGDLAQAAFIPAETQAGDALVHDVRCVHFSKPMNSNAPRYTWYLEFRSEADLRLHGPWKADWINNRKAIWAHVKDIALGGKTSFSGPLRVPHMTSYLSYDQTSPYNHFANWNADWKQTRPNKAGTHHCMRDGKSIYAQRYAAVLPFHPPGLAPVFDGKVWFFILPNGTRAFELEFTRAFGFYNGLAAVEVDEDCFHIKTDGTRAYSKNWAWSGNFQEHRCTVRDKQGRYYHIRGNGEILNPREITYCGDFREGAAVIRSADGLCRHIDLEGEYLHTQSFQDLDVYHKGYARAKDLRGWHFIDRLGNDSSDGQRFSEIEPFYNGQSLVKTTNGRIQVINEKGIEMARIPCPKEDLDSKLNEMFIGFWQPLTVRLGLLAGLTAHAAELHLEIHEREILEGAWVNLGLLDNELNLTEIGDHLSSSEMLIDRALYWTGPQLRPWIEGELRLSDQSKRKDFFEVHADDTKLCNLIHSVLNSYAATDWEGIDEEMELTKGTTLVDLGGGKGALLKQFNTHTGGKILVDRPEVLLNLNIGGILNHPMDMFNEKLPLGDVYFLSRIIHDWSDEKAAQILSRIPKTASIYVVDRINENNKHGLLSLNMLITNGGYERNMSQWSKLFTHSGWKIVSQKEWKEHTIFNLWSDEI